MEDFWDFLKSPGFGGAAAIVAAVIAAIIAISRDRNEREHARRQAWWETLTWVCDRAVGKDGAVLLDRSVVVAVLVDLHEQSKRLLASRSGRRFFGLRPAPVARWTAEQTAVSGLVEQFGAQAVIGPGIYNSYISALDEVAEDLATRGIRAVTPGAEYRTRVLDAVELILRGTMDRSITYSRRRSDFSMQIMQGERGVTVRVLYSDRDLEDLLGDRGVVDQIRDSIASRATVPTLVVTNRPVPDLLSEALKSTSLRYVNWSDQGDDDGVRGALSDLGIVPMA